MAFDISFDPTFKHTPWIDAVDRVAAGGDNGFNIRFQHLEADLGTVGSRFTAVSEALNSLATTAEVARSVNIAAVLSTVGTAGWEISQAGEASKPSDAEEAQGAVAVLLPASGVITGFRAFGTCSGTGKLKVDLVRRKLTGVLRRMSSRSSPSPTRCSHRKEPRPRRRVDRSRGVLLHPRPHRRRGHGGHHGAHRLSGEVQGDALSVVNGLAVSLHGPDPCPRCGAAGSGGTCVKCPAQGRAAPPRHR